MIPQALEPLHRALPGGDAAPEKPWVHFALGLWYLLFVLLVVCPFALFWTWSRLCRPRRAAPGLPHFPKVSILIPAFNEQETILDAIHGALRQDYPDFEVIVIDDCSTDLTPYLAATQQVRLIRKSRNAGKAAALNSGLRAAAGRSRPGNRKVATLPPPRPDGDPRVPVAELVIEGFHPCTVWQSFRPPSWSPLPPLSGSPRARSPNPRSSASS